MRILPVIAALALSMPAWAVAAATDDSAALPKTCKEKLQELCPGMKPGGGRIQKCLLQQYMTLADVCPKRAAKLQDEATKSGQPAQSAPVAVAHGIP